MTLQNQLEQLQSRLATLNAGRDQLVADLHAQSGAIQECEYWHRKVNEALDTEKRTLEAAESNKAKKSKK